MEPTIPSIPTIHEPPCGMRFLCPFPFESFTIVAPSRPLAQTIPRTYRGRFTALPCAYAVGTEIRGVRLCHRSCRETRRGQVRSATSWYEPAPGGPPSALLLAGGR